MTRWLLAVQLTNITFNERLAEGRPDLFTKFSPYKQKNKAQNEENSNLLSFLLAWSHLLLNCHKYYAKSTRKFSKSTWRKLSVGRRKRWVSDKNFKKAGYEPSLSRIYNCEFTLGWKKRKRSHVDDEKWAGDILKQYMEVASLYWRCSKLCIAIFQHRHHVWSPRAENSLLRRLPGPWLWLDPGRDWSFIMSDEDEARWREWREGNCHRKYMK